jgi:hypothetical protein
MKVTKTPFTLSELLPKLTTSEDDEDRRELELLAKADAESRAVIIGGALIGTVSSEARVSEIVERLAGEIPDGFYKKVGREAADVIISNEIEHTRWAYRLGLAVGLRLAAAVERPAGGAR